MARNRRMERVEDLLREVIADKLRDVREPALHADDVLVTVTRVVVTSDLSYARVGISVLGSSQRQAEVMDGLERAAGFIRREVNREVRLRKVPELRFELDESLEHGSQMLQMLKEVSATLPEPEEEESESIG
ncbi:MAG: 30S ribosome-binding factor RbfA [Candidatus Eremiobacteraeota bacterium]|nr:30S ribosome-binding factor RbfA [Candidatus Eremiobacteraeota bacterium]